jgi:diguanylate cyclase (GGDEF)-like protein
MDLVKKTAGILFPAMRISFALVLLTICVLLTAEMLGFMPDETKYRLDARKKVSEALAVQFSQLVPDRDANKIQKTLSYVVKRNPDMLSAGIRLQQGGLIFQVGDHAKLWADYDKNKSTSTHLLVPLLTNNQPWGNIEIKYAPLREESWFGFFEQPIFKTGSFVFIIGFCVYLVFMFRTLVALDPSAIIPDRVNAAFDTLAEGVIILDGYEQIVLANKAFTEKIASPTSSLLGVKASKLKWQGADVEHLDKDLPWLQVLKSGKSMMGVQLTLPSAKGNVHKFLVNSSPIQGREEGSTQGVLITLDDITGLEEKNASLQTMVKRLEESQTKVQQQNKELHFLATRDSLTGCLNRHSLGEQFDKLFNEAKRNNLELACVMADLDHFKKVNDNYGHSTGDTVIKLFAEILHASTRHIDLVGRYGGEEFFVVLPGLTIEEAFTVAERIRLRIKDESANRFDNGPIVTASLGVASIKDNPDNPTTLNRFSDEALYAAKESGRNRVMRWQSDTQFGIQALAKISPFEDVKESGEAQHEAKSEKVAQLQLRVSELEEIATQFSSELEYIKNYDTVTGLPNQILFFDRISQVIERGSRHYLVAAILVVDIGMISQIKNTLGLAAGEKLLLEISARLNATFRSYDGVTRLTLSRFGGDEFAVLLTELPNKEAVTWMVKRLLDSLALPVDIDGNSIFLGGHVGISLYPSDASSVDDLINKAMIAKQYSKKSQAETSYQFFDQSMQELSNKHLTLDKELRRAIQNEEWELVYQPKISIKTKSIIGAEALIRWRHPQRGLLSPYEFIEFAEQRGLIVEIGDWVIKSACQQLHEWTKLGFTEFKVAVNLSAVQLRQDDFVGKVFHTLATTGVPPRRLELEVTESTLMYNFQSALAALKRLNTRGITIAIDDFGTGYSSLSYLKNLPINTLKIDGTFIKDICNNDNDKQIVKALINIAHSMNMNVVAEGVEEQNQYHLLTRYSCDEIQGYLFSKPVSVNEMTAMLTTPPSFITKLTEKVS